MAENEIIHIVPHSHWDREWYMAFEEHRFRLIRLMDSIVEKMERDPAYRYYHLDGQYIVLEDYFAVKPQMEERVRALVNAGRLQIGPWYVLQDEYLVSDEANVRNLLIGLELCRRNGMTATKIGYLPDSFGNIAQMPQILKKCGIDTVVFGRGVSNMAEVIWQSEDGSRVVGAHFTPWYNNAAELPTEKEAAAARADKMLSAFRGASAIKHYLGMNGSDHQPMQENLGEALRVMNENAPAGVTFRHSNLPDYMEKVKENTAAYPVIANEMAGQDTEGINLLISTASSRVYLKQENRKAQNMIERAAEPISTMAYMAGAPYPEEFLFFAWKNLLQNHPHDSICGCSVDEVHAEMMTRYHKTEQIASSITKDAIRQMAGALSLPASKGAPAAVFNTSAFPSSGFVSVTVDLPDNADTESLCLKDASGRVVAQNPEVFPHTFRYDLPEDAFRRVSTVTRCRFRFFAQEVPAMGWRAYFAEKGEKLPDMPHSERSAENEFVRLEIERDGSLTVTDRATGETFTGLNIYEDCTDTGNEYIFVGEGAPITTEGGEAEISLREVSPDHVTFTVRQSLTLPENFDRATGAVTPETVPFRIKTEVTLAAASRGIFIKTEMENRSGCHRLRALFRNRIVTDRVYANGPFDVLARKIETGPNWKWPTNEQRLQSFVTLRDDTRMMTVATRGLHEYEVLRDGSRTLCLNLLRAVDQLGDWGVFPTPDAQCIGRNTAEYQLFVGGAAAAAEAEKEAFAFSADEMVTAEIPATGTKPVFENSLLAVEGDRLWSTAFKKQTNGNGCVLRIYNTSEGENEATLRLDGRFCSVREADLAENPLSENLFTEGGTKLTFRPKEIKTLLLD